jgi:cytochrome c oxidase subunit 2
MRRSINPMVPGLSVLPKNDWRRAACCAALLLISGLCVSGCRPGTADAAGRGKELFETCVPCHGQSGEGNAQLGAPNIGGMKAWYVETQLRNFRSGARGANFHDAEGMRMRPMALSLDSDQDVQTVSRYVESLPTTLHPPVLKGDAHAGDMQYHAICGGCHGPNGDGNEALKAPRLAGVDDWYLATQLKKYKEGVRGASPKDVEGRLMAPMSKTLANEAAIRNVVAYIATLKP